MSGSMSGGLGLGAAPHPPEPDLAAPGLNPSASYEASLDPNRLAAPNPTVPYGETLAGAGPAPSPASAPTQAPAGSEPASDPFGAPFAGLADAPPSPAPLIPVASAAATADAGGIGLALSEAPTPMPPLPESVLAALETAGYVPPRSGAQRRARTASFATPFADGEPDSPAHDRDAPERLSDPAGGLLTDPPVAPDPPSPPPPRTTRAGWATVTVPLPDATAAASLPPGAGTAPGSEPRVMTYAERRMVPIDLAPVAPAARCWRLDDTRTEVTVGPPGPAHAALRAARLYRGLLDEGGGLALLEPGEGFATWQGSPLWLALAGIAKPARLGVLPATSPGRVEVRRTLHGDWLVAHQGGPWPARRELRHEAAADTDLLLLDVLYGIADALPDATSECGFERALAEIHRRAGWQTPSAWRAQEAWALIARAWACLGTVTFRPTAEQAILAAVTDGLALPAILDPLALVPASRALLLAAAQSGDPAGMAAALAGFGRRTLGALRRGGTCGIGPIEGIALACCLGRLPCPPQPREKLHA